jgi:hypothetical protein
MARVVDGEFAESDLVVKAAESRRTARRIGFIGAADAQCVIGLRPSRGERRDATPSAASAVVAVPLFESRLKTLR